MLKLLFFWNIWVPCRGVFRRDVVMQSELFIRPTYETWDSDAYWLFGLGLKGRFYFVPSCHCKKRFYPTSTSARWGPRRKSSFAERGHRSLLVHKRFRHQSSGSLLWHDAGLSLWSLLRMIGTLTWNWKLLSPERSSSMRQFLERILSAAARALEC